MRPYYQPLLPVCVFFYFFSATHSNNEILSFTDCSNFLQWEVIVFSGAVVIYNGSLGPATTKNNCSLTLKTSPSSTFLVRLIEFNFTPGNICSEHLTLIDLVGGNKLLDASCNLTSELPKQWITTGNQLEAVFIRNPDLTSIKHPSSFKIIITSIKFGDKLKCPDGGNFICSNFCITPSLLCDNIPHCPNGEDEKHCTGPASPPPYPSHAAPTTLIAGTPIPKAEKIYLWLPLIVVVVFTSVMLALILVGRRATRCNSSGYRATENCRVPLSTVPQLSTTTTVTKVTRSARPPITTTKQSVLAENLDAITIILVTVVFVIVLIACLILGCREQKQRSNELQLNDSLRVEINSNPGFNDGAPATPPPTYSMIERQTSYVSHISQTSSQLSFPPDYDDVVDPEESVIQGRRRRLTSAGRSNSSTSRWSRPRVFQRSQSAQDNPRNRYFSDPGRRARNHSDQSDTDMNHTGNNVSDTDSVFLETPNYGRRQSQLENVSEVDESLGNSTILTDLDESVNSHRISNNLDPIIAQPRPALQRSISDVTDSSNVRFTLE